MFKAIARLLSNRKTIAPHVMSPDNRHTESEYAFYADLLARGLNEAEAGDVLFKRCVAGEYYLLSKGHSAGQVEAMPATRLLTVPTDPVEYEYYRACAKRSHQVTKFYGMFGLNQGP